MNFCRQSLKCISILLPVKGLFFGAIIRTVVLIRAVVLSERYRIAVSVRCSKHGSKSKKGMPPWNHVPSSSFFSCKHATLSAKSSTRMISLVTFSIFFFAGGVLFLLFFPASQIECCAFIMEDCYYESRRTEVCTERSRLTCAMLMGVSLCFP